LTKRKKPGNGQNNWEHEKSSLPALKKPLMKTFASGEQGQHE